MSPDTIRTLRNFVARHNDSGSFVVLPGSAFASIKAEIGRMFDNAEAWIAENCDGKVTINRQTYFANAFTFELPSDQGDFERWQESLLEPEPRLPRGRRRGRPSSWRSGR